MPSIQASHRLDRDTSGCLLLSKDPSVHDDLIEQFRRRKVTKTYVAIVYGSVAAPRQSIRDPLDGLSAITHLEVTATGPRATVVRIRIETGRTHQIRRHLASRNHPVLGDKQYGGSRVRDARLQTRLRYVNSGTRRKCLTTKPFASSRRGRRPPFTFTSAHGSVNLRPGKVENPPSLCRNHARR